VYAELSCGEKSPQCGDNVVAVFRPILPHIPHFYHLARIGGRMISRDHTLSPFLYLCGCVGLQLSLDALAVFLCLKAPAPRARRNPARRKPSGYTKNPVNPVKIPFFFSLCSISDALNPNRINCNCTILLSSKIP
jgi:hypothetical protein